VVGEGKIKLWIIDMIQIWENGYDAKECVKEIMSVLIAVAAGACGLSCSY
jgi:hypothetical protein